MLELNQDCTLVIIMWFFSLDINECRSLNGGCNQICVNQIGSFLCACRKGFRLLYDRKSCGDINECSIQTPCDLSKSICRNFPGSYQCVCKKGYQMHPNNRTCIGKFEWSVCCKSFLNINTGNLTGQREYLTLYWWRDGYFSIDTRSMYRYIFHTCMLQLNILINKFPKHRYRENLIKKR